MLPARRPIAGERRQTDRREVRLVVEGCPGVRGAVDWVTNLSLDGVRIERKLPVWPGSEIEVSIRLPGGHQHLRARAAVVPGHASGTGLRFLELEPLARVLLAELLAAAPIGE